MPEANASWSVYRGMVLYVLAGGRSIGSNRKQVLFQMIGARKIIEIATRSEIKNARRPLNGTAVSVFCNIKACSSGLM